MEDYVEEYKYSDCFWQKANILYDYAENKFKQFLSIAWILKKISKSILILVENLKAIDQSYAKPKWPNYTREDGIDAFFSSINIVNNELTRLAKSLVKIADQIDIQKDSYTSQKEPMKMCEEANQKYKEHISKLCNIKSSYFDSINKYVEVYLKSKYGKKGESNKLKHELENKKKIVEAKKKEYKEEIDEVEKLRLDYMAQQGNIFAVKQVFETECTQELKIHIQECVKIFEDFFKNFKLSEKDKKAIENIDGEKDTKDFAKNNRSFVTGPKRNLYKEYPIDLNYYVENFDIIKSKLKNKNQKEQRDIKKQISTDITNFLEPIIQEEPDQINKIVEQVAKDIKENCLDQKDFDYLIQKFQDNYDSFNKWKEKMY